MRRALFLLLCLSTVAGCHAAGPRKQPAQVTDPDRLDSIQSMGAAEKEAAQQLNKW